VVVLLDVTGRVVFAAPHSIIPPARGSDQSGTPLIQAALRTFAVVERDQTFVSYNDGGTSARCTGRLPGATGTT
jgi:hypothetical protein